MPSEAAKTNVASYALLGRTGLRVSPLCLGTMTFGTEWGWGSPAETARQILDRYLDRGGNFLDTADVYTEGKSEQMLGQFLKESGKRDRVVLATKFSFNAFQGDPNAGGNGRKNIYRALEGSLRRLQTDYVDLYWLHGWDTLTPLEEVYETLDALVRSGKVRYFGLSNTPAWYLSRMQTVAELRGRERVAALQLEYSLVERSIEREHVPAALELGMGICPWSPLASGFLSGKYKRTRAGAEGEGRLQTVKDSDNPAFDKFTEKNWKILDALLTVATEVGRSPAQVALNWVTKRPGVVSSIIGATKIEQLESNLGALDFDLPESLSKTLDEVGQLDRASPYFFFQERIQSMMTGATVVRREPPWFRP